MFYLKSNKNKHLTQFSFREFQFGGVKARKVRFHIRLLRARRFIIYYVWLLCWPFEMCVCICVSILKLYPKPIKCRENGECEHTALNAFKNAENKQMSIELNWASLLDFSMIVLAAYSLLCSLECARIRFNWMHFWDQSVCFDLRVKVEHTPNNQWLSRCCRVSVAIATSKKKIETL